jgi:Tfp pilus assembly protein PilN
MRAVNLIPADERRGAGGAAGRSGGAAYILLGTLALLVVMAGAYVITGKNLNDKKSELARVNRDAQAAQAKADNLAAYTRFSDLRAKRVQTVTSLANSRFDWAHALREVARVVPGDAWLTTLVGTVAPNVSVDGASTGAASLRGALPNPAVEVSGCTTGNKAVARMLTRMRLIDGVERVSLAQAEKADSGGGAAGGSGGASAADCRNGSDKFPRFDLVVFFKAGGVIANATGAPANGGQTASGTNNNAAAQPQGSTTTASQTTTTPSSSSQPASGGTNP